MPSRRGVIATVPVLFAGCTGLQNGLDSGDERDEIPPPDRVAGIFGVPVVKGYEGEPSTRYNDERIAEVNALQTLIQMAVDSDIPPESVQKRNNPDNPKTITVGHNHDDFSQHDLYEAVEALFELPPAENPDFGNYRWYIEHPERVLRVSYILSN
ncbi:hypothetical protein [Haloprofundus sp. MHR1]|uniref:hypothetical protein n=1 Tax=Haloprofundus sp. MHR1 TaxID=2572921 RepID=UPI0010BF1056|nr:hypothetical protein [Haloprofundus sp. MHR1]QCJ48339.1 hypothetical protein FCF25_14920 [Haloprofundus sp. MHR1]